MLPLGGMRRDGHGSHVRNHATGRCPVESAENQIYSAGGRAGAILSPPTDRVEGQTNETCHALGGTLMKQALFALGCCWAALLLSCRAGATEAGPKRWTLSECIQAALTQSPDLAAAAADIAAAQARLAEADAGRYGELGYTQLFGLVNEAKGSPVSSPNSKNDFFKGLGPFTRLDLHLSIPLVTFGKLQAALEAAQRGLDSERAHAQERRAEIIATTKQLYYGVLLARQLADILSDMQDALNKAVKTTEDRLAQKSRRVSELDLLKLKVGRARFAKGSAEVAASAQLAHSALARAVGAGGDESFEIADRKLQPVTLSLQPLEVYLNGALDRRPEWARVEAGLAAQQARVSIEEADYYPKIFFSTGVQYAAAGNHTEQDNPFAYDDFNYLRPVGVLGLNWDLNFFSTRAKVDQAKAELDRLRAQRREAETGLPLEVRKAYIEVTKARETMTAAEDGRKAGRGLLVLTVSNFDLALGSAEDLFNGLGSYTESSSDYLQSVHDYNVAVAALSRFVGEVTDLKY
ncbi:MAG TPA: TolC family protein [Candidatus Kryptonia bacterium]|nr:TolC family protein [Candidatus Kryptonia bacterium]